jgi:hypothetical protein
VRHSIGIGATVLVAASAILTWTLTQSGAKTGKLPGATLGINTLDLTTQAAAMPLQQFDAI